MVRLRAVPLHLAVVLVAAWCLVVPSATSVVALRHRDRLQTRAAATSESRGIDTMWPLSTLLEHNAAAAAESGVSWAPTPRTRLEKLQLATMPRTPEPLGNPNALLFDGGASAATNSAAKLREDLERAREPTSNFFNGLAPLPDLGNADADLGAPPTRLERLPAIPSPAPPALKPRSLPPPVIPAPTSSAPKTQPKAPEPAPVAEHRPYPQPPAPENMLASPRLPDCEGICDPNAADPLLARVPAPPLDNAAIAAVGLEGEVLKKVEAKLRNREGWLRAQKAWLSKATEAAATIRREIAQAEFTRGAVASDLEQLQKAQDALSIKYKADRLKWAFKDKKMTLEALKERFEALEHARADVSNQIREAKDDVTVLENTLGPPSQQVQISPKELEDPLEFLHDVIAEANAEF